MSIHRERNLSLITSHWVLPLCGIALVLFTCSFASAGMINGDNPPGFEVFVTGPGQGQGPPDNPGPPDHVELPAAAVEHSNGVWAWTGETDRPGRWNVAYEIEGDPDPFMNAIFTITNPGPTPANFTLMAMMEITPEIHVATLMGGSISATGIDVSPNNNVGPSISSVTTGEPMYVARADGVEVQTLYAGGGHSVTGDPNGTVALPQVSFGLLPNPPLAGPSPLTTNIEIIAHVRVSAGDTAIVVATFNVVPVPEPTSVVMLLTGAALLGFGHRRRSVRR